MYVKRSELEALVSDMIIWRNKAVTEANKADRIATRIRQEWAAGRTQMISATDVDRAVANDVYWKGAVGNNQMYDRWATRDATVIGTLIAAIEAGIVRLQEDVPENVVPFQRDRAMEVPGKRS